MTCAQCGKTMTTKRENWRYDASGLPGITLLGVEVSRCKGCGEYEVAIPRIEALHKAIAQALIRKPAKLTPAEIRFLRKHLGWSGVEFGKAIGTTPETVSRWEAGATPMGLQADRLLRLMVAHLQPIADYGQEAIVASAVKDAENLRATLTLDRGTWTAKAA